MGIRLGLSLPQFRQYTPGRDVADVARAAEDIGFDSVWVFERLLFPENSAQGLYGVPGLPWPEFYRSVAEPLMTLATAGAVTERVRLGSSVLIAPLHVPFQLAKQLATLDAGTGGRVLAGLGTGWSHDEYAASAVAPFAERGAQLDETLDVFDAVWGPNPVSYQGKRTVIAESEVGPKPARPIPVLLAASSTRALDRLARRADGWLPVGVPFDRITSTWASIREAAEGHGRDASDIAAMEMIGRANIALHPSPLPEAGRTQYTGSREQVVADVVAAAEAGMHELLLDLQGTARDAKELIDLGAELHAAVRAAGV
ncbi:LLM class F420-dependent oxidoreductase [Streptacidiphilus pinicola]|uniref:LLM class F420-dependent oxidoreductase n=1 Tax=Streptacidiphilus pinicola TaxID=2219663 RepID=A0A2X0JB71_9ACTN|nr:TIGR03619 family F420-dependent LLM class oxidoreductase [Streptacidiphilus pinicola]RAG84798.1 LLM class F420-dependent oxidoreductase [Streptacidiphilus pinicola]